MPRGEVALVTLCCRPARGDPRAPGAVPRHLLSHTAPLPACCTRELQGDHLLIPAQSAAGVAAVIPCVLWHSRPDVQGTLSIPENPAANGREKGKRAL